MGTFSLVEFCSFVSSIVTVVVPSIHGGDRDRWGGVGTEEGDGLWQRSASGRKRTLTSRER